MIQSYKNGDLSVTSISTSILGACNYFITYGLNAYLYLYNMSITSFFSAMFKHELSKLYTCLNISLSVIYFAHHLGLTMDICPMVISVLFPSLVCSQIC